MGQCPVMHLASSLLKCPQETQQIPAKTTSDVDVVLLPNKERVCHLRSDDGRASVGDTPRGRDAFTQPELCCLHNNGHAALKAKSRESIEVVQQTAKKK